MATAVNETGLDLETLEALYSRWALASSEAIRTGGPEVSDALEERRLDLNIALRNAAPALIAAARYGLEAEGKISSMAVKAAMRAQHIERLERDLSAANARADEMQRDRAALSDKLNGTPCAEIRWREEREELMARIAELESAAANPPAYVWRDMKDAPKDQDVILYFSTGSCRVPLVARYEAGYLDLIGLENWRVVQPIPGTAPTGWLPLIWKD